ncbi:MAG TPA: hypothetical protein VGP22_07650 [Albitalea sp.]|jgi:nicotinic acid phosphoribosyltransferase|nr:hypothetical protein [Albitalea sp.]
MTADPPIIRSLLDTELFKFTMWQALLHSAAAPMPSRCRLFSVAD